MTENLFSLKNKRFIVTGASAGIGRHCAILFSSLGANLFILGRNADNLNQTFQLLQKGNHDLYSLDLKEYNMLDHILSDHSSRFGSIDGFVHCAGIELTLPLSMMKRDIYNEIFSINVLAGLELAKILSKKKFLTPSGASFVYISSIMGLVGASGKTAYCASKGAIISAVKAMALELAQKNIRVNSILPGVVNTDMTKKLFENLSDENKDEIIKMHPLGIGSPIDIANACAFLLSDASRWITGTSLIVDGGYSSH